MVYLNDLSFGIGAEEIVGEFASEEANRVENGDTKFMVKYLLGLF